MSWTLYLSSNLADVKIGEFDSEEKAYKKMLSLVKKEVKTTEYVKLVCHNTDESIYDYGMWGRGYKIIKGENNE